MQNINDEKFQIEVNGAQAKLIERALEEYFRLRMGQYSDFADAMAFEGFNYENHTDEEFNACIKRRDMIRNTMEDLKRVIWPPFGTNVTRTPEETNAIDIWHVIRHELYLAGGGDPYAMVTMANKPFQMGEHPLPKMLKLSKMPEWRNRKTQRT